jgi:5-methylcytosine-specific restriction endonuclease McrA
MAPRARLTPLSPGRFALQVTVDQETYDQLRYAQTLLGHAVPSGDVATVLKRALDSLIHGLEQRKFAPSARSRPRRSSGNGRYIPAAIRNAIWDRDGGQCTFVSESGRRCEERKGLDFDHIDPVARGGQTSVDRMRLLCRAHNQYTADFTFGPWFMREKREQAQLAAQARKRARSEVATAEAATATPSAATDVFPYLRKLGFSPEEARQGAALCADIPDAPLEKRVHVALSGLAPAWARHTAPA